MSLAALPRSWCRHLRGPSGGLGSGPRLGCTALPGCSALPSLLAERLKDVVGLYVDPPAHAVVLSVDEKSHIQALERTQPGLPLKPGHPATRTHDYIRHGTTTLFAALNVLEGTVLGRCMQRHRHQILCG
jgi:hypothetical protein